MNRRMRFVSRLTLLSLATLVGCNGALELSIDFAAPAPKPPAAPQASKLPPRATIFGKNGGEKTPRTQSTGHRGGALENFLYFYAEGTPTPPQPLPKSVMGHLAGFGDVAVTLELSDKKSRVTAGEVPLYEVRVPTSDGGKVNPCEGQKYVRASGESSSGQQASDLDGLAIAVPGAWDRDDGKYYEQRDNKEVFTLACMTGIAAKCVNWGYLPWGSRDGIPLSDYYAACIHAARAEYQPGFAYTCQGTTIDVYDRLAIGEPYAATQTPLQIEAAWGKDGPLCITAPRFPACEGDPTVRQMPDCDEAALSWEHRAEWPADVLLVTRSTSDNVGPAGACPKSKGLCGGT